MNLETKVLTELPLEKAAEIVATFDATCGNAPVARAHKNLVEDPRIYERLHKACAIVGDYRSRLGVELPAASSYHEFSFTSDASGKATSFGHSGRYGYVEYIEGSTSGEPRSHSKFSTKPPALNDMLLLVLPMPQGEGALRMAQVVKLDPLEVLAGTSDRDRRVLQPAPAHLFVLGNYRKITAASTSQAGVLNRVLQNQITRETQELRKIEGLDADVDDVLRKMAAGDVDGLLATLQNMSASAADYEDTSRLDEVVNQLKCRVVFANASKDASYLAMPFAELQMKGNRVRGGEGVAACVEELQSGFGHAENRAAVRATREGCKDDAVHKRLRAAKDQELNVVRFWDRLIDSVSTDRCLEKIRDLRQTLRGRECIPTFESYADPKQIRSGQKHSLENYLAALVDEIVGTLKADLLVKDEKKWKDPALRKCLFYELGDAYIPLRTQMKAATGYESDDPFIYADHIEDEQRRYLKRLGTATALCGKAEVNIEDFAATLAKDGTYEKVEKEVENIEKRVADRKDSDYKVRECLGSLNEIKKSRKTSSCVELVRNFLRNNQSADKDIPYDPERLQRTYLEFTRLHFQGTPEVEDCARQLQDKTFWRDDEEGVAELSETERKHKHVARMLKDRDEICKNLFKPALNIKFSLGDFMAFFFFCWIPRWRNDDSLQGAIMSDDGVNRRYVVQIPPKYRKDAEVKFDKWRLISAGDVHPWLPQKKLLTDFARGVFLNDELGTMAQRVFNAVVVGSSSSVAGAGARMLGSAMLGPIAGLLAGTGAGLLAGTAVKSGSDGDKLSPEAIAHANVMCQVDYALEYYGVVAAALKKDMKKFGLTDVFQRIRIHMLTAVSMFTSNLHRDLWQSFAEYVSQLTGTRGGLAVLFRGEIGRLVGNVALGYERVMSKDFRAQSEKFTLWLADEKQTDEKQTDKADEKFFVSGLHKLESLFYSLCMNTLRLHFEENFVDKDKIRSYMNSRATILGWDSYSRGVANAMKQKRRAFVQDFQQRSLAFDQTRSIMRTEPPSYFPLPPDYALVKKKAP